MRSKGWATSLLIGLGVAAGPAHAADNVMQACGARYQAAKVGKTLPAGQTWPQFLSACRASLAKPGVPATAGQTTGKTATATESQTSSF